MGKSHAMNLRRGVGNSRWRVGLLTVIVIASTAGKSASGGSASDARAYVDAHNAVRAAVQQPAGYSGAWTPIPPVAWSDEVAGAAQAWAEHLRDTRKCALLHSDTRDGENLAQGKDLDAAAAVKMWASERKNFRYSPQYAFDIPTGHYSQLVWRKTTHIGCGRVSCGRKAVVVCRYSPAGNRIGAAPY